MLCLSNSQQFDKKWDAVIELEKVAKLNLK
jgi:hypothetical protein